MARSKEKTVLQWLAPSMARDGLLTDGDWVMPNAARAARLFSDPRLDLPAQCMAAMHRYAIDYIEQAPVLVAVVAEGRDFLRRSDRLEALRAFKAACVRGLRLPELLAVYGLAAQMRVLDGKVVRVDQAALFKALSKCHPSTLAQRLPKSPERQLALLRCLERWRATVGRRSGDSDLFLEWAVTHTQDELGRSAAVEVADFASQNRAAFDVRWSMQQAMNASNRWHVELAMRSFAAEARRPDWRTPIDYGPLPLRKEVGGYEFCALQTREALFEEGVAMQHCVRTYADRVAQGTSRIYSVRQDGKRIATLELVPSMWGPYQFEFSQMKTVRNGRPESKASVAATAFIAKVNEALPRRTPAARPNVAPSVGNAPADQRAITQRERAAVRDRGAASRAELCGRLGQEVYASWFNAMEFEGFDGTVLTVSFPTRFLRSWVAAHYTGAVLECCRGEFAGVERVDVVLRQPRQVAVRAERPAEQAPVPANGGGGALLAAAEPGRTRMGELEGSPIDPACTFATFAAGSANRMAHAAATQVAESVSRRGDAPAAINPLFIHAAPGLGKTHLMHAIAWEVQRAAPDAQVLYLTAERFRFQFVHAMQTTDPARFENMLGALDLLLVDDLEFLCGAATEPAFERIIGTLLDRGGQLVLAAARPPSQVERLGDRMRTRLSAGLMTEIAGPDVDLRRRMLEHRLAEMRRRDATFAIGPEILSRIAERSENASGRDLAGVMVQIHAMSSYLRRPVDAEIADHVVHERLQRGRPPGVGISEILHAVSRHYGVSRSDLLSERRHRSVVWPRQVGMYLSRTLTARGIAEIGRRFGGRDHTSVILAIRKVEAAMAADPEVRRQIDGIRQALGCAPAAEERRRAA